MTEAYNNPLPEHDRWVQRIAGNRKLVALSRRLNAAFYCPTKSFRRLFGQLPTELNRQLLAEALNL